MCAIAGVLDLRAEKEILDQMLATMARRGPDGRGIFRDEGCALLHTRLAIIDPEGGQQPMSLEDAVSDYITNYLVPGKYLGDE